MIEEARQRYHSDINRELSMQDPNLEGVAQAEDSNQAINLEDWTITYKEFQPKRSKQPKKQISKTSQEKMDILPVGVKKRMTINCMAKVPIVLHSVRRHQLASLPGQMIRVPQPDRNAINLQCTTSAPHRVAKISKARKASVYCKEEDLIIQCPKKPEM